ncbi:8-oxo-dGTP diphosphatase MutT [Alteromonas sp. 5E99-2]|uniref:8-oxo-dGTP diphosphatase MutT n=1 Tax=Alteromonas sp. 5E99-2 TaxID=2817683 RepID=UPI001A9A1725|nr:8-oxo-dGTP diphosphatase MutT [Alteromonas sp. 5E99-2]MBO1256431.1 8-oxo-dGTP diphosphatase MutT [Alteromonas sp. 5E99-2]
MSHVNVAVGVVVKDQAVFVCKRAADAHQGNLWEFPGGKIEAGESPEQGLARELFEEIDIRIQDAQELITLTHDYGDKQVRLHVYKVESFTGEAKGKEGQPSEWRAISLLQYNDFPAANKPIIDGLKNS